ncbi:c-type cytochrome biogenesis protein CcmI [Roseomonas sp. AR75]|uniref:c-type cytochrome biogenesis protein CcmI n=1 Tax=Roseomonas sp. AR75 TaxID=2562311 RepID=UPI0010C047F4|nr:c-type cytochrome biogenesis protein CcmI [Roseomonas sp. AR75]
MTIWILVGGLALLAMLPLAVILLRPARARGRGEADLALYRAQLAELDREKEAGRLDETAHAAARLEVQRRILAAPKEDAAGAGRRSAALLGAALFLVPAVAISLYLVRGVPDMPSAPYDLRQRQAQAEEQLLEQLRARIAQLDPRSEQARQGFILLGNAERNRGRNAAALESWNRALAIRFDPQIAADVAELQMEEGNLAEATTLLGRALLQQPQDIRLRFLTGLVEERAGRPANARRVWQSIVDDAPPDAPWREMMLRRIQRLP